MKANIWQIINARERKCRKSVCYSDFLILCADHKLEDKTEGDKLMLVGQIMDECSSEWKEREELLKTTYSFTERLKRGEVGGGQYIFPIDKFPIYWNIRHKP